MLVTDVGMSTDVRLLHPLNAQFPMLVTEVGITTCLAPLQSEHVAHSTTSSTVAV
jgi:hypothetical protein